jgi:hypothetical protein
LCFIVPADDRVILGGELEMIQTGWVAGAIFWECSTSSRSSSRGGGRVHDEMRISSELSQQLQHAAHQHAAPLLQLAQRQVEHAVRLVARVVRSALRTILVLLAEQLVLRDHLLEVVATDAEIAGEVRNHELQLLIDAPVATLLHDPAQAVHRSKPCGKQYKK